MTADQEVAIADGLITSDATPEGVRPYAFQARRRAEFHRAEAERLDAFADRLYRWIAKQDGGS